MADPISWMVVSAVASAGISYLFPSEGPRMADLRVSASTYGSMIPEVYGTCRVGANMIWNNPIREQKKKKRAGKGGGFYNEYTYYCDFAMGFCKGPIMNFRRLWADGKLIYDATGASEVFQSGEYRFRMYMGSETQLPDSLIEESKGEGNAPAYRGLAYMVFENLPLRDFGNRIPQMAAEVYNPGEGVDLPPAQVNAYDRAHVFPNGRTLVTNTTYARMVDLENGVMYAIIPGPQKVITRPNGTTLTIDDDGLAVIDYVTGEVLRYKPAYEMGISYDEEMKVLGLFRILAIAEDGSIMVHPSGGLLYSPILRVDPVSLNIVGRAGETDVFVGNAHSIPTSNFGSTPAGAANGPIYCHIGFNVGNPTVCLVDLIGMKKMEGTTFLIPGGSASVVADRTKAGTFYLTGTSAGGLAVNLFRYDGGEPEPFGVLGAAELDAAKITAAAVLWDDTSPGPIVVGSIGGLGVGTEGFMVKFSIDDGSVIWARRGLQGGAALNNAWGANIVLGEYCWAYGNRMYAINTDTGDLIDRDADPYSDTEDDYDQADGEQGVPIERSVSSSMQFYDGVRGLIVTDMESVRVANAVGGSVTLAMIVGSILRKGNLTSKDFDLTALETTMVRGYGWASATDIKSILDELKKLYLFDLVEIDGRLVARLRADNTPATADHLIPQAVLGSTSPEAMDYWKETRLSEADLPERVSLAYMNIDDDFETSTAHSIRVSNPIPTMFSRQQVAMQVNLVATPTEAKDIVHGILYTQWLERTKHESRLPWAYLDLDPSDTIKVVMDDGRTYYDRVHMTEVGANYAIEFEAYGQDSGAYEIETSGDGGGAGRTDTVSLAKTATPFIFNTPLLRDADDSGGAYSCYYTAVSQQTPASFGGATVFRSLNALDYDELYGENVEVEWGTVINALPAPRYGYEALDWENQIIVAPGVNWFDVSSITDDELWAGANLVVVGDEVLQFRDAVENADGTWTLSNLLRGRRGTEYACAAHKPGDRFVFLDALTIEAQADVTSSRGQTRAFKAVGAGRSLIAAPAVEIRYEPRDLMPYAPGDIRRTFSGANIVVAWSRRTRLGGNLRDGTGDVPLSEAAERYEAYILTEPFAGDLSRGEAPLPETIVRAFNLTHPTFTYTSEMMVEDGYVMNVDTLHLVLYQMSDAVGRGFPAPRSITPDREF